MYDCYSPVTDQEGTDSSQMTWLVASGSKTGNILSLTGIMFLLFCILYPKTVNLISLYCGVVL